MTISNNTNTSEREALSGYAVYGIPSGQIGEQLSALIARFAKRFGTPFFEPHVSLSTTRLQGELSMLSPRAAKAAQAIARLAPLEISCDGLGHSDAYFRCLFLKVKKSAELQSAYEVVEGEFGNTPGAYTPHISLLYARLPELERERLVQELAANLTFPLRFSLSSMHLYSILGTADQWKSAKEFAFF